VEGCRKERGGERGREKLAVASKRIHRAASILSRTKASPPADTRNNVFPFEQRNLDARIGNPIIVFSALS
jgi:hypothetical protein